MREHIADTHAPQRIEYSKYGNTYIGKHGSPHMDNAQRSQQQHQEFDADDEYDVLFHYA